MTKSRVGKDIEKWKLTSGDVNWSKRFDKHLTTAKQVENKIFYESPSLFLTGKLHQRYKLITIGLIVTLLFTTLKNLNSLCQYTEEEISQW